MKLFSRRVAASTLQIFLVGVFHEISRPHNPSTFWIADVILGVVYGIKANRGEWAGYPIIGRWCIPKLVPSLSFRVTARLAPRKERKGPMGAGFEASEQQGEAYILTGEKTVQLQRAENAILLRIQMSHGALGTGSASPVRLSGFVSGIVVGDLLDLFELLDEAGLSNLHSRLVHSTVKQGYQRQCENA